MEKKYTAQGNFPLEKEIINRSMVEHFYCRKLREENNKKS